MKSILIIGSLDDDFCRHLKKTALQNNFIPVFLKIEDIFDKLSSEFYLNCFEGETFIKIGKKKFNLKNLAGVFPRFINLFSNHSTLLDSLSDEENVYVSSEWSSFFKGLFNSLNIPVINLIPSQYWNRKILYSIDLNRYSKKVELKMPSFIVSNDPVELEKFFHSCRKNVLYSPQSQTPVNIYIDSKEKFESLSPLIKLMPLTLFEVIEGERYSVYVTGKRTFAVNSKGNQSREIPGNILNDCLFISNELNITFTKFEIIFSGKNFYLTNISLNPDFLNCSSKVIEKILSGLLKKLSK